MTVHTAQTAADVWDAHTLACKARGFVTLREGNPCQRCRGSQHTAEMRLHAARVTTALTGVARDAAGRPVYLTSPYLSSKDIFLTCPLCVGTFSLANGQGDRAIPGHAGGRYSETNIAMVCRPCNAAREFASHDAKRYAEDVRRASERVISSAHGIMRGPDYVTGDHRIAVRGTGVAVAGEVPAAVLAIAAGPYGI